MKNKSASSSFGEVTKMISFGELAKRWNVSRWTLQRAVARGDLHPIYFAGRWFVPMAEIERVEERGFAHGRKRGKKAAQ